MCQWLLDPGCSVCVGSQTLAPSPPSSPASMNVLLPRRSLIPRRVCLCVGRHFMAPILPSGSHWCYRCLVPCVWAHRGHTGALQAGVGPQSTVQHCAATRPTAPACVPGLICRSSWRTYVRVLKEQELSVSCVFVRAQAAVKKPFCFVYQDVVFELSV